MARTITIVVVILLVVLAAFGLRYWMNSNSTEEIKLVSQEQQTPTTVKSAEKTIPPNNAPSITPTSESSTSEESESTEITESVEAALKSMNTSLSTGDARTPELAPQYEREKPSPEVLANPELYADYELGESKKIVAVYLSALSQIPILRARIESARSAGNKSTEEIAEAEEALAMLEALKSEIERDHPDMIPANSNESEETVELQEPSESKPTNTPSE